MPGQTEEPPDLRTPQLDNFRKQRIALALTPLKNDSKSAMINRLRTAVPEFNVINITNTETNDPVIYRLWKQAMARINAMGLPD
jgi:hypothetical protein